MSFRQFVGLRISTQAGAVPTAADISEGELAFNVADGRVFTLFGETVTDITDRYTQAQIDDLLEGKADVSSLADVATSGAYSDLSGKPSLGTAAAKDATAFDPAGTASGAISAHEVAPDPHGQYVKKVAGKGLSTEDYTSADRDKLSAVGTMANRDAYISDQPPDSQVGQDGDIWLQHWS